MREFIITDKINIVRLVITCGIVGSMIYLFAGKRVVEGFWMGHWAAGRNKLAMIVLFRQVADLIRSGVLATDLGREFPLDAIGDAVREAEAVGRRGKVLLRIARE